MASDYANGRKPHKLATLAALGAAGAATTLGIATWGAAAIWSRRRAARSFPGHVVVITGGSRGLGFAMAQEFARRGARLAICGRDQASLQKAEARLRAYGAEVLAVPCDISVRKEAEELIRRARDYYGRIDVLVNNAGEIAVGPLESQTIEDFERSMNVMFWGMVYTTMAVLPLMRAKGAGRIVNITSIGGKVAVPHLLPYACAKFAAVGFSEGLRAESARCGIKVTTVVPGLMRTGSHINALFKGDHRKEYGWFSMAATLPVSAMDAHRAARQIIDAASRGKAEIILTPQAELLALVHGIAPGLVTDALAIADRLIPGTGSAAPASYSGNHCESVASRLFVTKAGRVAEWEFNQHSKGDESLPEPHGSWKPEISQPTREAPPLIVD